MFIMIQRNGEFLTTYDNEKKAPNKNELFLLSSSRTGFYFFFQQKKVNKKCRRCG
jgi:hypothetical protein